MLALTTPLVPTTVLHEVRAWRRALTALTTARLVDGALAGGALASALWGLHALDEWGGLRPLTFYSTPMLYSALLLFGPPTPPPAGPMVLASLGAFAVGLGLHHAVWWVGGADSPATTADGTAMAERGGIERLLDSVVAQSVAAGLVLLLGKASGAAFLPAVGLAAHLAQSGHMHSGDHIHTAHHPHLSPHHAGGAHAGASHLGRAAASPFGYLLAPWAAGHLVLYAAASAAASARHAVRLALTPEWATPRPHALGRPADARHDARLRELFARFDTAGDGTLDAAELKLALRCATGEDLSLEHCERLVRAADGDGDGALDVEEWKLVASSAR